MDHNDDRTNPALIDARKTYVATIVIAAAFIGSVILFIL